MLSLAEELLLIGLDDELGIVRPDERLDVTLAGAWIAELIPLERVDEPDYKLRVIDSRPTGPPTSTSSCNGSPTRAAARSRSG